MSPDEELYDAILAYVDVLLAHGDDMKAAFWSGFADEIGGAEHWPQFSDDLYWAGVDAARSTIMNYEDGL